MIGPKGVGGPLCRCSLQKPARSSAVSPVWSQSHNSGFLRPDLMFLSPLQSLCCDNRDIPELAPCFATGLSFNSSRVCGMSDHAEPSSQAARGHRGGNEEQQSTRAPERPQQGPSHADEHKLTGRISVIPRAHLEERCPCAACS